MNENRNLNASEDSSVFVCPSCDFNEYITSMEIQKFTYGTERTESLLEVKIPVHECKKCGFRFTDDKAEELRHEAICRHLGLMTPKEVYGVRAKYNLSRSEFAKISKLGEASLARWENSLLIQNAAYDNYLYLLLFEKNMNHLRDRERGADNKMVGFNVDQLNIFKTDVVMNERPKLYVLTNIEVSKIKGESSGFKLRKVIGF